MRQAIRQPQVPRPPPEGRAGSRAGAGWNGTAGTVPRRQTSRQQRGLIQATLFNKILQKPVPQPEPAKLAQSRGDIRTQSQAAEQSGRQVLTLRSDPPGALPQVTAMQWDFLSCKRLPSVTVQPGVPRAVPRWQPGPSCHRGPCQAGAELLGPWAAPSCGEGSARGHSLLKRSDPCPLAQDRFAPGVPGNMPTTRSRAPATRLSQ